MDVGFFNLGVFDLAVDFVVLLVAFTRCSDFLLEVEQRLVFEEEGVRGFDVEFSFLLLVVVVVN